MGVSGVVFPWGIIQSEGLPYNEFKSASPYITAQIGS